jgi:hypothetical protein
MRESQLHPSAEPPRTTLATGFTLLVGEGRWTELRARLQRYLPALIEHVGLDSLTLGPLVDFVLLQARELKGRRLRELLPRWMDEFAREQQTGLKRPLREADLPGVIERGAVRQVLAAPAETKEPAWAAAFRRLALEQGAASGREILDVPLSPELSQTSPFLPGFRRQLAAEIQREVEERRLFFELT